jgi:L-iditol 2-dehydrogenase
MKGIYYDLKLRKAVLKKIGLARRFSMIKYREDWPVPEIEYPNQVKVRTRLAGICAGDLHQINVKLPYSATIIASKTNPFPMGHEAVGEVTEIGKGVEQLRVGDRVVFSPLVTCEAYGFAPCNSCKDGHLNTCQAIAGIGDGSPLEDTYGGRGQFGGFSGGGFSEHFVAFERQLTPVPESIPDDVAVLVEPLTIGIHAALRKLPKENETVLVIGCGIIGLMTIAALRTFSPRSRIVAAARYPFQGMLATGLGADEVIVQKESSGLYGRVAELTEGILLKPLVGKQINYGNKGPAIVFDVVGTDLSIDDALRLVQCNGTVVLVGNSFGITKKTEWALQLYKELDVLGSMNSGLEHYGGKGIDSFDLAVQLLGEEPSKFKGLVTHRYRIDEYRKAFEIASNKGRHSAVKVAFDYSS